MNVSTIFNVFINNVESIMVSNFGYILSFVACITALNILYKFVRRFLIGREERDDKWGVL